MYLIYWTYWAVIFFLIAHIILSFFFFYIVIVFPYVTPNIYSRKVLPFKTEILFENGFWFYY